jgi:hypothetical protein
MPDNSKENQRVEPTIQTDSAAGGGEGGGDFLFRRSGPEVLRMRAKLAVKGQCVCERCGKVGPARQSLSILYKGNVLSSLCPTCLPERAILIQKDAARQRIQVRLVDPDRSIMSPLELPSPQETAAVHSSKSLGPFGPKVEKKEY